MSGLDQRVDALEAENQSLKTLIQQLTNRLDLLESAKPSASSPVASRSVTHKGTARPQTARPHTARSPITAARVHTAKTPASADKKATDSYFVSKKRLYVQVPEQYKNAPSREPAGDLTLQYAYGYNGKSARDNLYFVDSEEVVYCIAGTCVVWNPATKDQRFYTGHNEDVVCLSKQPNGTLIASGQTDPKGAGKPYVPLG